MKKILLLFIAIALIGCEEKIINVDDVTQVHGIVYFKQDMTLVTGKVKDWYDSGQLKTEATFKDGKWDGVRKDWYENGQLKTEGTYKDGKWDGVHKLWNKDGKLIEETTYKDGKEISE